MTPADGSRSRPAQTPTQPAGRASVQAEAADRLPARYRAVLDQYVAGLQERPLSDRARSIYRIRAAAYLLWAATERRAPRTKTRPGLPAGTRWTSRQAVTSYRRHLDTDGRTPWTVNGYVSVAEDLIAAITGKPVQAVDRHPTPSLRNHILTLDEEARLAAALPDLSARDLIMVLLLWDTAAKPADLVALRARDITPTNNLRERQQRGGQGYIIALGEGRRRRQLLVPPRLAAALDERLPNRATGYGGNRFLLAARSRQLAPGGSRLTERSVSMIIADIGAAASQPNLTPTMLRRTALTTTLTEPITNPNADPEAFGLLARVDPIHARQVERSIVDQLAEIEKTVWTEVLQLTEGADPATRSTADQKHHRSAQLTRIPRHVRVSVTESWRRLLSEAFPHTSPRTLSPATQQSTEQPLEQVDVTRSEALLALIRPALQQLAPLAPAVDWVDRFHRLLTRHRKQLIGIYRSHLLTSPLLSDPASLPLLLSTRPTAGPAAGAEIVEQLHHQVQQISTSGGDLHTSVQSPLDSPLSSQLANFAHYWSDPSPHTQAAQTRAPHIESPES